ncbi:hypothetical protein TorRG33x02_100120 [Trema orientale]|uniref:Uncharacterized protein n=1 Tax=Trema orientale TaxID=63057 RepID=A0A2P5F932_TREOI|nr:hypothetical protein TorRG33x02_100120 [Trema orientale]
MGLFVTSVFLLGGSDRVKSGFGGVDPIAEMEDRLTWSQPSRRRRASVRSEKKRREGGAV